MNRTIEAIPTMYRGVQFRSRLEARWAVFFDGVGIKWQYEPKKIQLGWEEKYIPDFWWPHSIEDFAQMGWGLWIEIKPTIEQVEESVTQLIDTCKTTGHNGLLFIGPPLPGRYEVWKFKVGNDPEEDHFNELWFTMKGLTFQQWGIGGLWGLDNGNGFGSYPFFYRDPYDAYGIAMSFDFEPF